MGRFEVIERVMNPVFSRHRATGTRRIQELHSNGSINPTYSA